MTARLIGVTGTEHVAEGPVAGCNVQGPPGVKVTVPVGTVGEVVEVSVTVTVQLEPWLTTTVVGVQETLVVVASSVTGVAVTVTAPEVTVTGVPALSVTLSSNIHAPVVVSVPDEMDVGDVHDEEVPRLVKLVVLGASWSHWQV